MRPPSTPRGTEPVFAPDARPASRWPDSSRSLEGRSSAFGPTLLDTPAASATGVAGAPAVFDVCHVGVVLRAMLFVNGVMATGVMFAAGSVQAWASLAAMGAAIVLPGVLLWLATACV